mgnify:CR=1 FL=1
MKNKLMKISFCMVSVVVILVSMCPISAFAAPDTYYFKSFSKPTVNDYSGYVELLFEDSVSGSRWVSVLSWYFTPISQSSDSVFTDRPLLHLVRNASQFRLGIESAEGVFGNMCFTFFDANTNIQLSNYTVYDDESIFYHNVTYGTAYKLIGIHYYGDFVSVNDSSGLGNEEFYVTYAEDSVICYGINQLISGLYALIDLTDSDAYSSQLEEIISSLNSFEGSFEEFESFYKEQITSLLTIFNDQLSKLEKIVENTDYLVGTVDNILYWLYDMEWYFKDWYGVSVDSLSVLRSIDSKLNTIIEILNQKTDTEFTTEDPTQFDEYYDVENSLLDNDNVNVSDVVNVEVNQNALTVIWDYVERSLNSHGKVFGMVLTILSLGIIALILGR